MEKAIEETTIETYIDDPVGIEVVEETTTETIIEEPTAEGTEVGVIEGNVEESVEEPAVGKLSKRHPSKPSPRNQPWK